MTNVHNFSHKRNNDDATTKSLRPASTASRSKRTNVPAASKRVRVLLVTNHPDTASAMRRLLNAQGFAVDCAATYAEAIQAIEGERYNVLISDINLPDGTGFELMRHARKRGVVGIAMSGSDIEINIRRSKQAGFAIHIAKPLNIQQLLELLERLVCKPASEPSSATASHAVILEFRAKAMFLTIAALMVCG